MSKRARRLTGSGPAGTTLDELRVELMYPADDIAERYFRGQAGGKNLGQDVENGDGWATEARRPGRRAPE